MQFLINNIFSHNLLLWFILLYHYARCSINFHIPSVCIQLVILIFKLIVVMICINILNNKRSYTMHSLLLYLFYHEIIHNFLCSQILKKLKIMSTTSKNKLWIQLKIIWIMVSIFYFNNMPFYVILYEIFENIRKINCDLNDELGQIYN